jgi:NAD(P)-dependent dehydrogenase (short-subunit alcohol dehydrogenase family)
VSEIGEMSVDELQAQDRVAIISGATGGLGRALAAHLAADGWSLALLATSRPRLAQLRDELSLADDRTLTVDVDLRERQPAAEAVEAVYGRFGRVDALAHLVGGWTGGPRCVDSDDGPYAEMLDQHLWSTLNIVRPLVPRMAASGHGRIVAVSSPVAGAPVAGQSAYAVGKAAQETLLAALAREVADSGVTVNVLRVKAIDTEGVRDADPRGKGASMTTPDEICAAIRYLFSDAARVVTGQRIGLYGGA